MKYFKTEVYFALPDIDENAENVKSVLKDLLYQADAFTQITVSTEEIFEEDMP